jgi:hypothetical protein
MTDANEAAQRGTKRSHEISTDSQHSLGRRRPHRKASEWWKVANAAAAPPSVNEADEDWDVDIVGTNPPMPPKTKQRTQRKETVARNTTSEALKVDTADADIRTKSNGGVSGCAATDQTEEQAGHAAMLLGMPKQNGSPSSVVAEEKMEDLEVPQPGQNRTDDDRTQHADANKIAYPKAAQVPQPVDGAGASLDELAHPSALATDASTGINHEQPNIHDHVVLVKDPGKPPIAPSLPIKHPPSLNAASTQPLTDSTVKTKKKHHQLQPSSNALHSDIAAKSGGFKPFLIPKRKASPAQTTLPIPAAKSMPGVVVERADAQQTTPGRAFSRTTSSSHHQQQQQHQVALSMMMRKGTANAAAPGAASPAGAHGQPAVGRGNGVELGTSRGEPPRQPWQNVLRNNPSALAKAWNRLRWPHTMRATPIPADAAAVSEEKKAQWDAVRASFGRNDADVAPLVLPPEALPVRMPYTACPSGYALLRIFHCNDQTQALCLTRRVFASNQ